MCIRDSTWVIHTIIGAESFHCPVRDGKEWDQLAMVVRQTGKLVAMFCKLLCLLSAAQVLHLFCKLYLEEVNQVVDCTAFRFGFRFGFYPCLLYTSPSPRDRTRSRMP